MLSLETDGSRNQRILPAWRTATEFALAWKAPKCPRMKKTEVKERREDKPLTAVVQRFEESPPQVFQVPGNA
jgi:hypothetical protein